MIPRLPFHTLTQAIYDRITASSDNPRFFILYIPEVQNAAFPFRRVSAVVATDDSDINGGRWVVDVSLEYYAASTGAAQITTLMQGDLTLLSSRFALPDQFQFVGDSEVIGTPSVSVGIDAPTQEILQFGQITLRFHLHDDTRNQ